MEDRRSGEDRKRGGELTRAAREMCVSRGYLSGLVPGHLDQKIRRASKDKIR